MNNKLIQKIVENKIPCYFISPHLDDAVFSAGGLIAHLSQYTKVEVVTVFTEPSQRPYTLSAKSFLHQCGYKDASRLFVDRRLEDRNACALVGIAPRHLGYSDALWRKIPGVGFVRRVLSRVLPEFLYIYPIYRTHIIRGGISRYDKNLATTLGDELKTIVDASGEYAVFCPLALQTHVDHALVRDVCLANFKNVLLWQDFPYNIRSAANSKKLRALGNEAFRWEAEKDVKQKMISCYTSQVRAIFAGGNIPLISEVYYSPAKKNQSSMKDFYIILGIILLGICMYGATLRGAPGNPTVAQVAEDRNQPMTPFESSHELGPYGHIVNLVDRGSYDLTQPWADLTTPDVGVASDGRFYSYFAPGIPYLAVPFYLVGAHFGLAQVATFSMESLVSIITLVFIYLIGRRIFNLPRWAAFFAVLIYGFASTSWSYASTLYEHSFSAMFGVTMFYAAWRFAQKDNGYGWLYAAYVWLAYAVTITINYPDAVLMLPIMVYLAVSTFSFEKVRDGVAVSIRWGAIATFVVFAFVTGLQFWHNATYYGGWDKLAGELKGYSPAQTSPSASAALASTTLATATSTSSTTVDKVAVGFFHEQNIPSGFFILVFSTDRGLLFFSPIFILSLFGIAYVVRKKEHHPAAYIVPISLVAVNLFLYSAWGDPSGGWAYGPRYIIQSMPWLALFVGAFVAAVPNGWKAHSMRILAFLLFMFSGAVALLGALTTNLIPPKSAALLLPLHEYNYLLNLTLFEKGATGSFVYNTYLSHSVSLVGYFILLYCLLVLLAGIALFISKKRHE